MLILLFSLGVSKSPILSLLDPSTGTTTIESVEQNGPAYVANLQAGDTIKSFAGVSVENNYSKLSQLLTEHQGQETQIQVIRNNNEQTMSITIPKDASSPFKGKLGVALVLKDIQPESIKDAF